MSVQSPLLNGGFVLVAYFPRIYIIKIDCGYRAANSIWRSHKDIVLELALLAALWSEFKKMFRWLHIPLLV